jgi:hypothetical protein
LGRQKLLGQLSAEGCCARKMGKGLGCKGNLIYKIWLLIWICFKDFEIQTKRYFGFKSKDLNPGDFQIQSKVLNGF